MSLTHSFRSERSASERGSTHSPPILPSICIRILSPEITSVDPVPGPTLCSDPVHFLPPTCDVGRADLGLLSNTYRLRRLSPPFVHSHSSHSLPAAVPPSTIRRSLIRMDRSRWPSYFRGTGTRGAAGVTMEEDPASVTSLLILLLPRSLPTSADAAHRPIAIYAGSTHSRPLSRHHSTASLDGIQRSASRG